MEMDLKSQKNKVLSATLGGSQLLQMLLAKVKSTPPVYKCEGFLRFVSMVCG